MNKLRIRDLDFELFLPADRIREEVAQLAGRLDRAYADKNPVLIVVLNGAFIFAADLVRQLTIPIEIDFTKVASYAGTTSTGRPDKRMSWQTPLAGRHVIIVEDIVDKGHTLSFLANEIRSESPASVEVACLLFKSEAYQYREPVRFFAFEIPNSFVVGYGLDYDQAGRDLPAIYRQVSE